MSPTTAPAPAPAGAGPAPKPLIRNRNYHLLWLSRSMTDAGGNATLIALPLLVIAVTGSPAAAGLVVGANAAAQLVAGLPAGTLVDRWNRKAVMLACEVARVLALAVLIALIWTESVAIWHMVAVSAVLGVCNALFDPAEEASLPHVVPAEQLSTALSLNHARSAVGNLAGNALGGALFGVKRVLPFLAEALSHVASFFLLLFLKLPRTERERAAKDGAQSAAPAAGGFRNEMLEGLRYVWNHRLIRVTALCAVALNFLFQVLYLVIIVVAKAHGVPDAQVGLMAAMYGAGALIGALLAPALYRRFGARGSVLLPFWAMAVLTPLTFVAAGNALAMGAVLAGVAFLAPTANTAIGTYQLLDTPDRLRGRLSGAVGLAGGVSAALGPMAGGLLTEFADTQRAVLVCVVGIALLTVAVTLSPTLRTFPPPAVADGPPARRGEE